jgi:hypothetical protein
MPNHPERKNRQLGSVGLASPPGRRSPVEHVTIAEEAFA